MKLRIEHKALSGALKRVLPAVAKVTHRPVLTGVRLAWDSDAGTLSIEATDLDLTISTDVQAGGTGSGTTIVPAAHLARVVGSMRDAVTVELRGDVVALTSGGTEATLRTFDPREWPQLGSVSGVTAELTEAHVELMRRCRHAMHLDTTKPATCGLHLEGNRAMATDSARAAIATLGPTSLGLPSVTIPTRTVTLVLGSQTDGLTLVASEHEVALSDGTTTWRTRLITEPFPNVDKVLKRLASTHHVLVDRAVLTDSLERIASFPFHFYAVADATFGPDSLCLSADVPDVGSISDEIGATGGDGLPPTLMNVRHLLDLLEAHGGDEVALGLTDDKQAMEAKAEGLHLVVMPVIRSQVKW